VETWLTFLLPLVVAAIGPALLFLRFTRAQSGRINTSEAAQLWEQSRAVQEATERRAMAAETRARECEERERLWAAEQRENERRRHDR
jgi:hypothetical protein